MTDQERGHRELSPAERAVMRHREFGGKMQSALKCPVSDYSDFADWYTPGVAAACRAISGDATQLDQLTNRGNTVAIVSDGTRVLGLGNIGPEAGLPVMEGKALLFKYLGGVDAVPLCIRPRSDDEFVAIVGRGEIACPRSDVVGNVGDFLEPALVTASRHDAPAALGECNCNRGANT